MAATLTTPAQIDFAQVPAPVVVEALDYESILAAMKADLLQRDPTLADVLALESEPAVHILETAAYRELTLRQRVNDAAHAVMLAYAGASDLDQLGANRETLRLAGESDAAYRSRVQQAFNRLAAAGPAAAFIEHAKTIDASIADVSAISQSDGGVTVTVLAPDDIPTASATADQIAAGQAAFPSLPSPPSGSSTVVAGDNAPIINSVRDHLMQDSIKPLTDMLVVRGATVIPFTVTASLTMYPGPDSAIVLADARTALDDYLLSIRHMGYDATRSGLIAALSVAGVQNVDLSAPAADVVATELEIVLATSITLSDGGRDV